MRLCWRVAHHASSVQRRCGICESSLVCQSHAPEDSRLGNTRCRRPSQICQHTPTPTQNPCKAIDSSSLTMQVSQGTIAACLEGRYLIRLDGRLRDMKMTASGSPRPMADRSIPFRGQCRKGSKRNVASAPRLASQVV